MNRRYVLNTLASAATIVISFGVTAAMAQENLTAKSVVLVHGAFADGSAWNKVIPLLEEAGLDVSAAQIPLTSLQDDAAATDRAIARSEGPVVLVGHSWGGVVITEAGAQEKVHSLVYVSAFVPDLGRSVGSYIQDFPHADGLDHLQKDAAGFYTLSDEGMTEHFAFDLPADEIALIAATQGPVNSTALGAVISVAAWKTKPNFAIVTTQDRMTHTDMQRAQVKKLNATAVEVETSHVPMLTNPQIVADLIIEAAK